MAIEQPYPELDELLLMIGEAGQHLSVIEAAEGAAGHLQPQSLDSPVQLESSELVAYCGSYLPRRGYVLSSQIVPFCTV
jgi:hypothetical protein